MVRQLMKKYYTQRSLRHAEGATGRGVFETYVEHVLAPALRLEQVVVMVNLTPSKEDKFKEIIEG